MDYRYKRSQIFKKKLDVPEEIRKKIYASVLTIEEYQQYNLINKIPTICLESKYQEIINIIGIEKALKLDWNFIFDNYYWSLRIIKENYLNNQSLTDFIYQKAYQNIVGPERNEINYQSNMSSSFKKSYPQLFLNENTDIMFSYKFYKGNLTLSDILENWDILQNKDLGKNLKEELDNHEFQINNEEFHSFINENLFILKILPNSINIYALIREYITLEKIESKKLLLSEYIKPYIAKNIKTKKDYYTNDEYKEIFKYLDIKDYLSFLDIWNQEELIRVINHYGLENILNTSIPFYLFHDNKCSYFIITYGLNNILEFDIKSGGFFSNNNWEYLKLIDDMYLHYAGNNRDEARSLFIKPTYENGQYNKREYTKEEFNEVIRRMIIYGPTNFDYREKPLDYRRITGEFRDLNPDLFINETLPEEFQSAFYTKKITPNLITKHPDYIPFLKGKLLHSCFKEIQIRIINEDRTTNYPSIYEFLSSKTDFDNIIKIISDYADVFETLFSSFAIERLDNFNHIQTLEFNINDNIETIKQQMDEKLYELIIKTNIKYSNNLPQSFKDKYPTIFISREAPEELQEKFYQRQLDAEYLTLHPEYQKYLQNIDIEVIFKSIYVRSSETMWHQENLITNIKRIFGNDKGLEILLAYGKYLEKHNIHDGFNNFIFNSKLTPEEALSKLENNIYLGINKGYLIYDEKLPKRFKDKYPHLFLPENTPNEIKEKFYHRDFTLEQFNNNPELLNYFTNTDIACSLAPSFSWLIGLFKNNYANNDKKLKILNESTKIKDVSLQEVFRNYIIENADTINIEQINQIVEVLFRLSYSNSNEMLTFRNELANQLLLSDKPIESLNKIEDIFLRNNIPAVGKIFSVFQILHPNCTGFNFTTSSTLSPVLKHKSSTGRQIIIFADLLKAAFGSNNRSIQSYLKSIENGEEIFSQIAKKTITYEQLSEEQKIIISQFIAHLNTLYNNTIAGKKTSPRKLSGNINQDIIELIKLFSPDGNLEYDLKDRIIKMFCHFAGFSNFEQAKHYLQEKIKLADNKNRNAANKIFKLEVGDFIKGIGDIKYLPNILQNGSVAKEFLGSSADSDMTPLDTDLSRIITSSETIYETIRTTAATSYGPIWIVLKNDNRFSITRSHNLNEIVDEKPNLNKLETFHTGVLGLGHYGIRTGFASSEIDYLLMEKYDQRVGLEIAMNGFYIPIVDKSGNLIFTPNDYDEIRSKMAGLSHFNLPKYSFSSNLESQAILNLASLIPENIENIKIKRNAINTVLARAISSINLKLKTVIDGDLTEGSIELIDTGSTGRGTNMPGDGDFDFMMRLDKKIIANPQKLNEVKTVLLNTLGKGNASQITSDGDFRLKNIIIEGLDVPVDIDITFVEKTDKLAYSTEMALQDCLNSIKKQSPEQYSMVIANILFAKKVLKEAGVYKPNRGTEPQGGLGGVGIENWILQNNGSFYQAAQEFLKASENKSFSYFKKEYAIWDFGSNHLASKYGFYPHDNFVDRNMSQDGYLKMKQTLIRYINELEYNSTKGL